MARVEDLRSTAARNPRSSTNVTPLLQGYSIQKGGRGAGRRPGAEGARDRRQVLRRLSHDPTVGPMEERDCRDRRRPWPRGRRGTILDPTSQESRKRPAQMAPKTALKSAASAFSRPKQNPTQKPENQRESQETNAKASEAKQKPGKQSKHKTRNKHTLG